MAALTFKVGGDTSGLGRALGSAKGMMTSFAGSVKNLGIGAAFMSAKVAVAGFTAAMGLAVKEAIGMERSTIAFEALTGSVEEAAEMMAYLDQESKRTGVGIGVMEQNIKRLIANGMGVEDAKELTRSLLDVSGTLGMTSAEAGLLGSALSQVKAKGVASMEELRQQIAERGVPIFEVLAEKIGVSKGELIKMVSEGKVGADVVIDAFKNLEGPLAKFRGGAEKMAGTAVGAFMVLKAELVSLLKEAGGPFLGMIRDGVLSLVGLIKQFKGSILEFSRVMSGGLKLLVEAFKQGQIGEILKQSLLIAGKEFINFLSNAFLGLGRMMGEMFSGLVGVMEGVLTMLADPGVWKGLGVMLGSVGTQMGIAFLKAIPEFLRPGLGDDKLAEMGRIVGALQRVAAAKITGSDGAGKARESVTAAMDAMAAAFKDQMENGAVVFDSTENREAMQRVIDGLQAAVDAKKKADEKEAEAGAAKKPLAMGTGEKEWVSGVLKPVVSSMTRIGGGGAGAARGSMILARKRNQLLVRIEENTRGSGVAKYA